MCALLIANGLIPSWHYLGLVTLYSRNNTDLVEALDKARQASLGLLDEQSTHSFSKTLSLRKRNTRSHSFVSSLIYSYIHFYPCRFLTRPSLKWPMTFKFICQIEPDKICSNQKISFFRGRKFEKRSVSMALLFQ